MAQSITLLRSHFYLAGLTGAELSLQSQPLFSEASAAVEDLSTVFHLMRELIEAHRLPAEVSLITLACAVDALSDALTAEAEVVFAGTGVRFKYARPLPIARPASEVARPAKVRVDLKRTRQALASMLRVALECTRANSVMGCSVVLENGGVKLSIEPTAPLEGTVPEALSEAARLQLAVAEANLLGQQASLTVMNHPFALSLRLPFAIDQA